MSLRSACWILALTALLTGAEGVAGTGSGTFSVNITLANPGTPGAPPSGICVSQTLTELSGALVQVVCSTEQVVSISPLPGAPFIAHGGAYTYYLSMGTGSRLAGLSGLPAGTGTVTEYRIYDLDELNGTFELLVGF